MTRYFISIFFFIISTGPRIAFSASENDLWLFAKNHTDTLKISTLFTAQNVRDYLSTEKGRTQAVNWCKSLGITRVFIESYRGNYFATRKDLAAARDRFRKEGITACGCVTTTQIGKRSTGWNIISCYTDKETRKKLSSIFKYAASMFDLIMIDDFLFTDCSCKECKIARGNKSWARYRLDLMCDVSRRNILQAARESNPNVKVIIKYPQWYDNFHNRGYDVIRQTKMFDFIWVGTETRDPDSTRWGRKAQYEAYFIMQWLGCIGGEKTGGGWFDPYGTKPATYCEQARQTVLAGAREMLLFCYGSLQQEPNSHNPPALRHEIKSLFRLAGWIRNGKPRGIPGIKPPSSEPNREEQYIFDWIGMIGIPLVPMHRLPDNPPAVLATSHIRAATGWKQFLKDQLSKGRPVLATKTMVEEIKKIANNIEKNKKGTVAGRVGKVIPLTWKGDKRSIMDFPADKLFAIRNPLLKTLGLKFDAPGRVALYLPAEKVIAMENFSDKSADIIFSDKNRILKAVETIVLPIGAQPAISLKGHTIRGNITPRTLVVWRLE